MVSEASIFLAWLKARSSAELGRVSSALSRRWPKVCVQVACSGLSSDSSDLSLEVVDPRWNQPESAIVPDGVDVTLPVEFAAEPPDLRLSIQP